MKSLSVVRHLMSLIQSRLCFMVDALRYCPGGNDRELGNLTTVPGHAGWPAHGLYRGIA